MRKTAAQARAARFRPPGAQAPPLWAWTLAGVLSAVPAAGQGSRAPAEPGDAPITVTTRVRHVTTIVLPESASIVDVVVGDGEYWDVSSAAHLAFIRPLVEDARSNLVLLTASGAVIPLLVVEQSGAAVDAVVRLGAPGQPAPESKTHTAAPVLTTADEVAALAARAAAAWEAVEAAEERATGRVETARTAAQEALDIKRESYPRQLQFDYRWAFNAEPASYPWLVEGLWHDGRRTYLRTRATSPTLYERADGGLEPVPVAAVLDDVLHVVPRVLGPGALEVDGRRITWTVERREAGP